MQYIVTKKYARGSEARMDSFKDILAAKKYIQEKLTEDAAHKVNAIYSLYEGMDLIEEFDQSKRETSSQAEGASQESASTFKPTPFSTTPRPQGMPPSWVENEEKKDKK